MNYYKYFFPFFSLVISTHALPAQNRAIDVQHYCFSIGLNDSNNIILGKAAIRFLIKKPARMVYFDLEGLDPETGKGMVVDRVAAADQPLKFTQEGNHLDIFFGDIMPVNAEKNILISYSGVPADGLIISKNKFGDRTFFSDNWPNRAHDWIPCNDHPADKASVEFIVTAPDHYQVISNGILVEETNLPGSLKLTHWKEDLNLPTKVMVIGAAEFAVQRVADVQAIPIWSWVFPENRDSGFAQYAVSKNILPFYISYIGPYPYKKLANVQSKTIFGGMENAGNIFYYQNSVITGLPLPGDYEPIEPLFAHEMAHQWFGDEASETDWPHLWLSEGFATYMTNLYMEHRYGTDSLQKRMRHDRDVVIAFYKRVKTPVVDTSLAGNLMLLLNPNSYEKGSWVLHMLRRKLGDATFKKGIQQYYAAYKGKNASTSDFMHIMEKVSRENLEVFFKQWLFKAGHPILKGTWRYDPAQKMLNFSITQTQDELFVFPLEVAIRGAKQSIDKTIAISEKITSLSFPVPFDPVSVQLDPGVNLLFAGKITEEK